MRKTVARIGKIIGALVVALIIIVVGLYALALWQSYLIEMLENSLGI
jgi:hypothetical protein